MIESSWLWLDLDVSTMLTTWLIPLIVLALVALSPVLAEPGEVSLIWLVANVALVHAWRLLMAIPHELGHAIAARGAGWKITAIHFGEHGLAHVLRDRRPRLLFHALDGSGFTEVWPGPKRGHRLRDATVFAAGPCVHVLALTVLLAPALLVAHWLHFPRFATELAIVETGIVANGLSFLAAAWPRALDTHTGNDGWHLVRALCNTADASTVDWARARLGWAEWLEEHGYPRQAAAVANGLDLLLSHDLRRAARRLADRGDKRSRQGRRSRAASVQNDP